MISVHLCQCTTCPGLEASSVIYFCGFSVSFLSQGREDSFIFQTVETFHGTLV